MLELKELKERIKNPKNRANLNRANKHERLVRFHTQLTLGKGETMEAATDFLEFCKSLLLPDKYSILLNFFQFPVDTVPLVEEIFQALEKVFDGRNPVFYYEFENDQDKNDWAVYASQVLNEPEVWKTKGFEVLKTAFNSIMIVDLPSNPVPGKPEPYFYFLPIKNVVELEEIDGKIEWIAFSNKDQLFVYDDTSYRVFEYKDKEIGSLIVENAHDLTYCPAHFFWNQTISSDNNIVKRSPITSQLAALKKLLFKMLSKDNADLFASWPILWGYKPDCTYEDESGNWCDSGYIRDKNNLHLRYGQSRLHPCPKCHAARFAGAGSFVQVTPPESSDEPNLREPVGIIPADVPSLEYNDGQIKQKELKIYESVTGNAIELVKDQAINEKQVTSLFESRTNVLINLKKGFEIAQTWVDSTICRLRYGASFVRAEINYGDEFYLFTPGQILAMYEDGIKANLSHPILDLIQDAYYSTKFRHDPESLQRSIIIRHLEPFNHLSIDKVSNLRESAEISDVDFKIKVDFSSLIKRFERENVSIVEFGSGISFDSKINNIKSALESYVSGATNT